MRKFTFLLALFFTVLISSGKNPTTLQKRVETAKEKYSRVSQQRALLTNHLKSELQWNVFMKNTLKSAAATMKLDSTVAQILNLDTEIWENDLKEVFFYNTEMRSILWKDFEWDFEDKKWELYAETETEYNNQGQIISITFLEIDENSGEMMPDSKMEATYNEDGKIDVLKNFSYEDDSWMLEAEQKYHYNASGLLIQVDMQSVDEDEEMTKIKFINTYNASGQIEQLSMYFIDDEDELLFYQTNYAYDGNGRLIESVDWGLSFTSFMLERNAQTVYQYNTSGDVSIEIYSEWDGTGWVEDYKDEFSYSNTNFSEVAFPSFIPMFHMGVSTNPSLNKVITMVKTSLMIEGIWIHSETTTFHYSDDPSLNIEGIEENLVSLYPNPFTETVTLRWKNSYEPLKLEIYLVTGSRILEKQINSGIPVSLAGIDNGIYFFKLNNGKKTVYSGKLVKK
ncbi:MAG: T9SS type A sorting domain-containing protein [Mariniphaga sp.]|nr:T9SS type A sorting domain-containing protein [Mariniphaga sp.]